MKREGFESLVRRAILDIPEGLRQYLDNVDVVVQDWPKPDQLAVSRIEDQEYLLGLYEGVPLTERYDYGMVLPDVITLFQGSIEAICSGDEEIVREVRQTVVHEVAHHFGIDDHRLAEMGL